MHVAIQHLAPPPVRSRLVRVLAGSGLELGPGHQPFPVPPGVEVALVDQWVPDENRALFYELPADVTFPVPDIVANLDVDRLRAVADGSQDFVIASHVLEHLAEPLGMIAEVHRVLHLGGLFVVLLPDRRRTFDRTRFGTGIDHLVAEYKAGTSFVDDDHVLDFIVQADHLTRREAGLEPEPVTPELIEAHRLRSVHAHCWTEDEFVDVLLYCLRELHLGFMLEDGFSARLGLGGWEFGFLLRKTVVPDHDPSDELLTAWASAMARQEALDRWPVGLVLAEILDKMRRPSPRLVGAISDVIDVVLHRPDLRAAFAPDALDVDAALHWAAEVATGRIADSSASRLVVHRDALARWA